VYSVISVIDKRLPGNTKRWSIALFVDDQSAIFRILSGKECERERERERARAIKRVRHSAKHFEYDKTCARERKRA